MPSRVGFALRRQMRGFADSIITSPLVRWTWRRMGEDQFTGELPEFRPADSDAVREMMSGRYLLASKLVETGGTSPFGVEADNEDWWNNLHGFSWLRHFRDIRDPGERHFARMLVLDWIGREAQFDRDTWAVSLCAQRVLNWLRHLPLLLEGASVPEGRTIQRTLGIQIQSLRLRGPLAPEPVDQLFAAIALLGAEYCESSEKPDIEGHIGAVNRLLAAQLDPDGLHLSRNGRLQLQLLAELVSVRKVAGAHKSEAAHELGAHIDRMHQSLDALTLPTGELGYFNGTGHLPHDVLIAIQANAPERRHRAGLLGGYGILRDGKAMVVADTGLLPPPGFRSELHASALAFEFSYGSELILGNCGPAPSELAANSRLFRQGVAHSAPTINGEDMGASAEPQAKLDSHNHLLAMTSASYARKFGVEIERRLTLLSSGTTLVGQDRMTGTGKPSGRLSLRFHLAPGVLVHRSSDEGLARLELPSGAVWSFLWEGAAFHEEDSVRQSAYLGFHRTRQLVLEADVADGAEVAWIFTLEQS